MATKKISKCVAVNVPGPKEIEDMTCMPSITNNLVDAERTLIEAVIPDLYRISSLLYGDDEPKIDFPSEPKCVNDSTRNVFILTDMVSQLCANILRRL